MKNLVFGSTGLIGKAFYKLNYKDKFFLYSSTKKKKENIHWNLNKDLKDFPIKKVKNCFFLQAQECLIKILLMINLNTNTTG